MRRRFGKSTRVRLVACALACALLACGAGGCGGKKQLTTRSIYVSLPLSGPLKQRGIDMADAARLALKVTNFNTSESLLKVRVLDSAGSASAVKKNIDRATADSSSLAYVSGLDAESALATGAADACCGLLQLALAPAPSDAVKRPARTANIIWMLPPAPAEGRALAQYIASAGQTAAGFFGYGSEFANGVAAGFSAGIRRNGIKQLQLAASASRSPFVGAGSGKFFVQADEPATIAQPGPHTLVTPALAPEAYPPAGERFFRLFEDEYGRKPDRFAIFAYDAMGLVVDAIERVEGDHQPTTRQTVTDEAFAIKDRFGPAGHYDILPSGRTTLYLLQARGGNAPAGPASIIEVQR
jgi:ABC-type branched-subunit amino acid transport system substrate-binding protein